MKTFTFRNGADSLFGLTEHLVLHGAEVSPRGEPTLEARNVTIQITHPDDVTLNGIGRAWNAKIAAAEALQLIGGFSDAARMVRIAPMFERFVNSSTGMFDGAYGPRTNVQMQSLLAKLLEDSDTRQGIVQIWDYHSDQIPGSFDYPCTVYINFSIRGSSLLMTTHMRSNDVWLGWCYDLFQFTQLGWTVANYLGLEMGPYAHVVDSLHLYERDIPKVRQLTKHNAAPRSRLRGLGVKQDALQIPTWREFAQEPAYEFFNDEENVPLTDSEAWFVDQQLWRFSE